MTAHRTLIVATAYVSFARQLCAGIAGTSGDGMFIEPLGIVEDGESTITHYFSTGQISDAFAVILPYDEYAGELIQSHPGNIPAIVALAAEQGITITESQLNDLFAHSDISDQKWKAAADRLGIVNVQ